MPLLDPDKLGFSLLKIYAILFLALGIVIAVLFYL